jgi:hypothetical protein
MLMDNFEMIFEVENMWEPLEKHLIPLLGEEEAHKLMFMGVARQGETDIYLYKHSWSRNYINIDTEGNLYMFRCGDESKCDGKCSEECKSYYKKL